MCNRTRPPSPTSLSLRLTAGLLTLTMSLLGCPPIAQGLAPRAGVTDFQRDAFVPFPLAGAEGHVDVMGGNLWLRRVDLSLDTRLGTIEIGATYNSSLRTWRWSFDSTYGTAVFRDASGASHPVAEVGDGQAIPGTRWVKLDARRIKTKSGRVHHFDATRRLVALSWGQIAWPRIELVGAPVAGRVRTVAIRQCTDPSACEAMYEIRYDAAGRVVAIDDRAGRRAEFSWSGDRLVAARDGLDVEEGRPGWRYAYQDGRLTSVQNSDGEQTRIGYEDGRVIWIQRVGEDDPTQIFHYTGEVDGLYATRHWDALGRETVYRYDDLRRLHEVWNLALDEHTRWSWSGLRPTSRLDPDGRLRVFVWSGDDRIREILPSGNRRDISYAPDGIDRQDPWHRPVLRIEDDLGLVIENRYDAAGRLIATRNGVGEETVFGYDRFSTPNQVTGPDGRVTDLIGGESHGHPTWVRQSGGIVPQQTRRFDAVGNRVVGAPLGRIGYGGVGERLFDAGRHVRRIALDFDLPIEIEVRADGRQTRITRPGGDDHEMRYDALGRLVERRERADGVWQSTTFEYDAVDNRTAVERPNGMRQEYDYDAVGRTIRIRNLRDGVLEGEASFQYVDGRLASASDSIRGGTEFYVYDGAGRLAAIQHAGGRTTTYGYDARDRRRAQAYLDANLGLLRIVHFELDGADRVIAIRDGLTRVLERSYVGGRLTEVRYGNGLVRSYAYDENGGPLVATESRDADGDLVESTTLERRLTWPTVHVESRTTMTGAVSATREEHYELASLRYQSEPVDRLRVTGYQGAGGAFAEDDTLAYDGRSNLLQEGSKQFHYNDEGNRLLEIDFGGGESLDYGYDAAGFATHRGGADITWHANGRIASHGLDQFDWDVLGRPLASTIEGVTRRAIFDGSVSADGQGDPALLDLDEVSIDLRGGGRVYRHLDFRGNVKFTSDDAGEIRSVYTYSPFGVEEVLGASDDGVRFVTRATAGDLVLMGARVYDPDAGRFLSPDPIFQLVNQYAYTLANPVEFHDRNGTRPEDNPEVDVTDNEVDTATLAAALQAAGNSLLLAAAILLVAGLPLQSAALALAGAILLFAGMMVTGWRPRRREEEWLAGLG